MIKILHKMITIGLSFSIMMAASGRLNIWANESQIYELSNCTLVEVSSDTVGGEYKTYQGSHTYYIHEQPDGTTEAAYLDGDTVIYKIYQNGILQETVYYDDSYFNTRELTLTQEDSAAIDSIVQSSTYSSAFELEQNLKRHGFSSVKVEQIGEAYVIDPFADVISAYSSNNVSVGINELLAAFPERNKFLSGQQNFTSVASNNSAAKTRTMLCRDTRNSYTVKQKKAFDLPAGMAVVAAAAKVFLTPTSLRAYIGLASSISNLATSLTLTRTSTVTADASRQACIYDDTYFNREVSVYTLMGVDTFNIGVQSDYSNAGWYGVNGTLFSQYDTSSIIQQGISAWNYNLNTYGYWRWGDL